MARAKIGPGTIVFYGLVGFMVYFAAAFSMQGFLTLGTDLAGNIPTLPLLGWITRVTGTGPTFQIAGLILVGWAVLQSIRKSGVSLIDIILFCVGMVLLRGAQSLIANVGGVLGFCIFAWFNAVQLSSWAGLLLGFDKTWAKKLKAYITVAYVGEFIINLLRFPPYADGRLSTFIDDARFGVLDPTQINFGNLLWMVVSIFAVEFTFVFFIKLVHEVQGQMKGRSQRKAQATSASSAQKPSGNRKVYRGARS